MSQTCNFELYTPGVASCQQEAYFSTPPPALPIPQRVPLLDYYNALHLDALALDQPRRLLYLVDSESIIKIDANTGTILSRDPGEIVTSGGRYFFDVDVNPNDGTLYVSDSMSAANLYRVSSVGHFILNTSPTFYPRTSRVFNNKVYSINLTSGFSLARLPLDLSNIEFNSPYAAGDVGNKDSLTIDAAGNVWVKSTTFPEFAPILHKFDGNGNVTTFDLSATFPPPCIFGLCVYDAVSNCLLLSVHRPATGSIAGPNITAKFSLDSQTVVAAFTDPEVQCINAVRAWPRVATNGKVWVRRAVQFETSSSKEPSAFLEIDIPSWAVTNVLELSTWSLQDFTTPGNTFVFRGFVYDDVSHAFWVADQDTSFIETSSIWKLPLPGSLQSPYSPDCNFEAYT